MELKAKHKFAFCFGAVGKDVVYMLISSYLLYYYNAVLGMSSVFIGAVLMAARVFDAFNDPFMGIVVAKTRTRFGKFRPWIFAGTVLNAVTIYALFAVPSIGDGGQRVWLAVFYVLWGVTYTLMDIPFWSMIPAITKPGKDREQLSSLARSSSGIGDAIPSVLTMTIVPILSGSSAIADSRIGFKWWALIIAIFFVISETVCVLVVPEDVKNEKQEKATGIIDMFKALFRNDQAMTMVVSVLLVYTALNIVGNLILYFFQFDVGDSNAYSLFVMVCFAAQVIAMLCFPIFRKWFGKSQLFLAGFVIQIVGFLLILLLAKLQVYKTISWMILFIPGVLVYVGYGTLNVLLTIFLSDTVDYGEYKYKSRDESVIFSMQTFTVKLASGFAVFLAGLIIDWVNLDSTLTEQTAETLSGLRMWMTIPSIILLIVGIIVYLKFYKLDEKKLGEIMTELDRRKAQ